MKKESVIITALNIQPKQVRQFQIKIPREVENIIGIEMGMQWISGYDLTEDITPKRDLFQMMYKPNVLVGDLKLQSFEQAKIFYAGELVLNNNQAMADFTRTGLTPQVYTHQQEANEEEIKVTGKTTIIQGVYKDQLYNTGLRGYNYNVNVYLWTESKQTTEETIL